METFGVPWVRALVVFFLCFIKDAFHIAKNEVFRDVTESVVFITAHPQF